VVDFGAKGDGVTDDTKVGTFAALFFQTKSHYKFAKRHALSEPEISNCNSFRGFALQMLCFFALIFT
jgi:hypothetical protein